MMIDDDVFGNVDPKAGSFHSCKVQLKGADDESYSINGLGFE